MEGNTNKPVRKFVVGNVSASIWKNTIEVKGEKVETLKTSLQKSYKDKDGNWQNTNSLDVQDLPKARLALLEAYKSMTVKEYENESETQS